MVKNLEVELFPELSTKVVQNIGKYKLDAYLIALEGWRRGLKLTWYKDETNICTLYRMNGSTQGKFFTLSSKTKAHSFFRSRGDGVSNRAVSICQDKDKTKNLLKKTMFQSLKVLSLKLIVRRYMIMLPK